MQYQPSSPASSSNDHELLMTPTKKRKVGVPKFLRYLYQILEKEDPSIISWANSGTSIQILDTDRVAQYILPKYFKHSKYASFQRQLNYFGFRKWTKSQTNICTFSHPEFRQNRPDRLHLIKRKNSPESSRKKVPKPVDKSPNLQLFPPQFQNTYRHPVPMNFDFLTPPGTSSPSSAGFHRNLFPTDMFEMNGKKELFPKQTSSPSSSHLMSDIENLHIQSDGPNFNLLDVNQLMIGNTTPLMPMPLPTMPDSKEADNQFDFDMNCAWLDSFTPVEQFNYSGTTSFNQAEYA